MLQWRIAHDNEIYSLVTSQSRRLGVQGKQSQASAELEGRSQLTRQTIIVIIMFARRSENWTVLRHVLIAPAELPSNNIVIETAVSTCRMLVSRHPYCSKHSFLSYVRDTRIEKSNVR